MANVYNERIPTRSALLELQEEQRVVKEGYDFLDKKRLLLAAEMLRLLDEYERLMEEFHAQHAQAGSAYIEALARHGLQGIQVYPVAPLTSAQLTGRQRSFLGVPLQETWLELDGLPVIQSPASYPSPEARYSAQRFHELLELAAVLAGLRGNLHRLMDEYRRTERRARALENVLLPEIGQAVMEIATRLEEIDMEDAVRVRFSAQR